jgi:hypothetical protein
MSTSLNGKIDWIAVMSALDTPAAAKFLPTTTDCPICRQGRLRLIQDICQIGAWFHCRGCGKHGDMIDLVSRAKNYNDVSAARYLQEIRAIPADVDLLAAVAERRRAFVTPTLAMQKMWVEASRQGRVVVEPKAQSVLSTLRLHYDTSLSWSSSCIGKILGTLDADVLEDYLRPRRDTSPRHCRQRPRRVLRKEDRNVLIVPYFDVPGRIRTVGIIREQQASAWDIQYFDVRYGDAPQEIDGGVAMHPKAIEYAIDNKVLVTADTELYLRMSLKNFSKQPTPLPLICSRQGDSHTKNWQILGGRQAVIWSPSKSPQAIWQAIQLDADVSCEGPQLVTRADYVRQREPYASVRQKIKHAQPWPVMVAQIADTKSEDDLADWLARAHLSQQEQQLVLSECPGKLRDKLKRAMGDSIIVKSFSTDGGIAEQRSSGWYFSRKAVAEHLVTDAPFRIREAFADGSDGVITYRVDATYLGHRFAFHTDASSFQADPFRVVQEQAVQAGVGMPTFDPRWRHKAMHWSLQFHTPVTITAVTHVGMDRDRKHYSLPGVRVFTANGRHRHLAVRDTALPGKTVDARIPLQQASEMLMDRGCKPAMAIVTGIACQLLCDIAGVPQPALLLSGDNLTAASNAVRQALDCYSTDDVNVRSWGKANQPQQHRWPIFATPEFAAKPGNILRSISATDCPLVFPATQVQAAYSLFTTDHIAITDGRTAFNANLDYSVLGRLLLETITLACRENFQINFAESKCKLERTKFWLRQTFKYNQLPWRNWRLAAEWCQQREDASQQLLIAAATLIVTGELRTQTFNAGKAMDDSSIYYQHGDGIALIPFQTIRKALRRHNCPLFDYQAALLAVTGGSAKIGIRPVNGKMCWAVKKLDLQSAIASRRQVLLPSLRIVG